MSNYIDDYRKNVSLIPPLSKQMEETLGWRIQEGDQGAIEKLAEPYLKLALMLADEAFTRPHEENLDILDFIECANTGLMLAVRRYHPAVHPSFRNLAEKHMLEQLERMKHPSGE